MQSVRLISQAILLLGFGACFACSTAVVAAQPLDPAMIEARRQRSNPSVNVLTYRHLDELFDTREVSPGSQTWALPRSSLTLSDDAPVKIGGQETTLTQAMQDLRINAILVMKDGRIVKEIHRNGGREDSRYASFSMSKSWISMLFGIAQAQGHIGSVDDLVTDYLPELKGTAYDNVTLSHLLNMRAGTSWKESYAPGSELDALRDASTNIETAYYEDFAREVERVAEPGTVFNYTTLETELVGKIIARATGKTIAQFMTEAIWQPAGMEAPGYWIMQGPRGQQHEWYGAGFGATLRDYGRLGQLMLDGGKVNDRQIIPREWVEVSTHPTATDDRYFYKWWGGASVDGFAARGMGGQNVIVDRATRTVMVVTSYGALPGIDDLFKSVVEQLQ